MLWSRWSWSSSNGIQPLFRKLDAAAATMHEDDKTLGARLRKLIDSATRTRDFVDYHEAGGWAAEVDTVLDSIAGLASGARAGLAIARRRTPVQGWPKGGRGGSFAAGLR